MIYKIYISMFLKTFENLFSLETDVSTARNIQGLHIVINNYLFLKIRNGQYLKKYSNAPWTG
jgi:hypothetical protein